MKLFLARHGEAEDSLTDSLRPLTNEGKRKSLQLAKVLKRIASGDSLLVQSPLLRSIETTDILAKENAKMRRQETSLMSPYGDPIALSSWIIAMEEKCVVLVGHEPQLSSLASYLLLGELRPILQLKKSGLIAMKKEHDTWSLRALLSPKFY